MERTECLFKKKKKEKSCEIVTSKSAHYRTFLLFKVFFFSPVLLTWHCFSRSPGIWQSLKIHLLCFLMWQTIDNFPKIVFTSFTSSLIGMTLPSDPKHHQVRTDRWLKAWSTQENNMPDGNERMKCYLPWHSLHVKSVIFPTPPSAPRSPS